MCFIREPVDTPKKLVARPLVIDEYHCKIGCALLDECLSYVFSAGKCVLIGEARPAIEGTCRATVYEMVKHTNETECTEDIEQPPSYLGLPSYLPNPVLAAATQLNTSAVTFNTSILACANGYVIDLLLPNNTHQIHGNGQSTIVWDGKLETWIFIKKITAGGISNNISTYIRSAGCYMVKPSDFADTTACGGRLPTRAVVTGPYADEGAVLRYGVLNLCPSTGQDAALQFITDYNESPFNIAVDISYVTCIEGSWFWLADGGTGQDLRTAFKIKEGTCVTKING